MSRFSGPQGKGAQQRAKERRRLEAEQRDTVCPIERRGKRVRPPAKIGVGGVS